MTRETAVKLTRERLDQNNLSDWSIRLNASGNQAYLGLCSYKDKCIILNALHLDIHPDPEILNTINHEVAHALTIGHSHDDVWAAKAKELGCTSIGPCSHLNFSETAIDAIRSGATLEVTYETEIIHKPKYQITRLQDKCEFCGRVAKEKNSLLIKSKDDYSPDTKMIWLECGHILNKKIPKGTPFHLLKSDDGKSPYPFQSEGMQFIEAALSVNKGAGIFDEMGLGKGQILTDNILTPNDWKLFGDLKVNDDVIGSDGKTYQITAIYDRGKLPVYKVTFTDESFVTVDIEHLWQVNTPLRNYRQQSTITKHTLDLINDLKTTSGNNKWQVQTVKAVEFERKDLPIEPYQLGLLLGDGSFRNNQINITSIDQEIINIFNYKRKTDITYFLDHEYLVKIRELGLNDRKSNDKFIPDIYRLGSINQRLALLQGLMDTDGSIWNNGVIEYTSVSPYLAKGIKFLVESLGGTVKISTKQGSYTKNGIKHDCQISWRVILSIPINPFRLTRKAILYKDSIKYKPIRIIKSIEFAGIENIRCISVNSPDNLYVTNDFIITHNTIQSLGYLKFHPEAFPILCLVKSGIKFQWFKEILRWLGDNHVGQVISSSNDYLIPNLKVYIASYDMLVFKTHKSKKTGKDIIQGFDIEKFNTVGIKTVILDECQLIKNPDASRTKRVREVVKDRHVIGLSGTPWKNRGSEFFTILNILAPMKFPSYKQFCDRWVSYYFDGENTKEGGINDVPAFKEYIKDIAIRRERSVVMAELPIISRNMFSCQLDDLSQNTYNDEVSDFVKWYNDKVIGGEEDNFDTSSNILAKLARMRHITGLAKIPATQEFVDDFVSETDRKLCIFVHHKDVGAILFDSIYAKYNSEFPVMKITADMDALERFQVQEKFNKSPRAILIGSTLASGEGLNLQSCADCIIHERQWNPANEEQAEGRFIRIGQQANAVNATYMIGTGTVDEILSGIVEKKRAEFHNSMNNGEMPAWKQGDIMKELAEGIVKMSGQIKGKLTKMASL